MTEFFVASNIPHGYPLKLQKPSTASQRVRDTAEVYIMDSGIGDDVSNHDVLELATDLDADHVVAKDYLHDRERTTESILAFLDAYDDHACDADVFVPLQPPHDVHYRDLEGFDHYMLGGMAVDGFDDDERVDMVRRFRRVEPDAYVHALGVGGGLRFVSSVAGRGLVDSADAATPELAAMYGSVLDDNLRHNTVRIHSGDGARKRNTPLAEFNAWQIQDAWDREAEPAAYDWEMHT